MSASRGAIDQLLGNRRMEPRSDHPVPEIDPADDYTAFSYGRVGRRPQMMVSFVRSTGETEAISYSLLYRVHSENIDRGFTAFFGPTEVVVEGQQLGRLLDYLCEHRVATIREAGYGAEFAAEGEAGVVSRLVIRRPELPISVG